MYVDISELAYDDSVTESISILPLGKSTSDDYGAQSPSTEKPIEIKCVVVEKTTNVLDVKTGSYLPRMMYRFYIPTSIVYKNELKGAEITREDKSKLIVVSKPIVRKYVSHCVVEATEMRV